MFLGIDVGTSAVKLSLVSPAMDEVASASAPLTTNRPQPYWSEQDPEDWWRAVETAMAGLRDQAPGAAGIAAIGLSGQMHGAVTLDAERRVIRPAILWNDGRSFAEAEALAERMPGIGDIAGVPPLPGFTAPKIMWLRNAEPVSYARIAHILLPKDFVGLRLHGELATDRSDAAGTLWLDQAAREWSEELCRASDTSRAWLPPCLDSAEIAGRLTGEAAAALNLPAGIPVVAGGGDAATGAVGIGAVRDGDAFVSLGTSGQLFVATKDYRPNPGAMVHAFVHAAPGMWYQMAAMLNGARPMSWFADVAGADIGQLLHEAERVDAAAAPLFLPYLTGERSPHGDPHIRGGFYGLADDTGRAEMMRGVVNAIAFSFADAAAGMRTAGAALNEVSAIGGGARSDLLLQTMADVLNVRIVRRAGSGTGPAFGAAKLAGHAMGAFGAAELGRVAAAERVFDPDPAGALIDQLERYRAFYRLIKPLSRAGA